MMSVSLVIEKWNAKLKPQGDTIAHWQNGLSFKRLTIPSVVNVIQLELSCFANGNVKWYKAICQFLKKLNIHLPYDPAIPLVGINAREMKAYIQSFYMNFHSSFIWKNRNWGEKSQMPSNRWINHAMSVQWNTT